MAREQPPAERKAHPFAARFPMMDEEDLAELAADIKKNGQQMPIVVDGEGQIIDGRNRLEACRRAGVEPIFEELAGGDPVDFILSLNVRRRHLTKGQRAMAVAMAYQEPAKGGPGKKGINPEIISWFTTRYLQQARVVLAIARNTWSISVDPKFWRDEAPLAPGKLRTVAAILEQIAKLLEARGAHETRR